MIAHGSYPQAGVVGGLVERRGTRAGHDAEVPGSTVAEVAKRVDRPLELVALVLREEVAAGHLVCVDGRYSASPQFVEKFCTSFLSFGAST